MNYSIDLIQKRENGFYIVGWASENGRAIKKICIDCDGKKNDFSDFVYRDDVMTAGFAEKGENVGFAIDVENADSIYLILVGSKNKKIDINRLYKSMSKETSKNGYKYKSVLNLLSPRRVKNALKMLKEEGISTTVRKAKAKINSNSELDYELWFAAHKATKEQLDEQRKTKFEYSPKYSIVVPTYNTPEKFLIEMIDSVISQTYLNWELCIADGTESHDTFEKVLNKYASDERIKFVALPENRGISGNTNAALTLATGDYIVLLDHDDLLAPEALYEVTKAINEDRCIDVLYTDEDKISMDLKHHFEPSFKPDFSIDLLRSNNYICHMFVASKDIVDKIGGFRSEYDGSQDYDFIFRCTFFAKKIKHISKILYHWRMHQNSVAANPESKMYAYEAGKRAIEYSLEQYGLKGTVAHREYLGFYNVKYNVTDSPKVSIIIPNKDERDTLKTCIDSILEKSTYTNYEIVVVENNSTTEEIFEYYKGIEKNDKVKVVRWEKEFNYSAINNFGINNSDGEYVILLNNDTEIITKDWIEEMLGVCQRSDVGIVGAKLYYPDDTVQHAGVVVGLGGIAGHIMNGIGRNEPGYMMKALIKQDVSAVTAACLMVKRSVFDEVGGLEEELKVAFNDVDFCLKVREKGYMIVYNPDVELYHYESKSRGMEDTPEKIARFGSEIDYMRKKWNDVLEHGDPFYNKNFSLVPNKGYQID